MNATSATAEQSENVNTVSAPVFSVYQRGYMHGNRACPQNRPSCSVTLSDVHKYITSPGAQVATETLRQKLAKGMSKQNAGNFKLLNFPAATFSGVFSYRKEECLVSESHLLVLDFDGITSPQDLQRLRLSLLLDDSFTTQLLFISPSGHGLKWVIRIDDWYDLSRADFFRSLSNYICANHGFMPDPSGKDIARLCFLCHDPEAYIAPEEIRIASNINTNTSLSTLV